MCKLVSPEEFAKHAGSFCPKLGCTGLGTYNTPSGSFEVQDVNDHADGTEATVPMRCGTCGSTWLEVWNLTGFRSFEDGDGE